MSRITDYYESSDYCESNDASSICSGFSNMSSDKSINLEQKNETPKVILNPKKNYIASVYRHFNDIKTDETFVFKGIQYRRDTFAPLYLYDIYRNNGVLFEN